MQSGQNQQMLIICGIFKNAGVQVYTDLAGDTFWAVLKIQYSTV